MLLLIPGIQIKLDYTGIPVSPIPEENILIPGIGPDYGSLLGGYFRPATLKDAELYTRFPYMNTNLDGKYFWLQSAPLPLSKLSSSNIAKIPQGTHEPIIISFDIYQKFKLECGFPKKCGKMTYEEFSRNGKCRS